MGDDGLKVVSRGDILAARLKAAILSGELKPGDTLVERHLASQYGVSKTPVREALRSLVSSRLIVARGYKAMVVQPLTAEVVDDVFQLRLRLEPWAAELAAHHGAPRWISELEAVLRRAEDATDEGDLPAASVATREFHRLIYARSGNALLVDMLDQLQDLMAFISVNLWKHRFARSDESSEHREIAAALAAGDGKAVNVHMTRHLEESQQRVAQMLSDKTLTEMVG